jgi:hypothetical protein
MSQFNRSENSPLEDNVKPLNVQPILFALQWLELPSFVKIMSLSKALKVMYNKEPDLLIYFYNKVPRPYINVNEINNELFNVEHLYRNYAQSTYVLLKNFQKDINIDALSIFTDLKSSTNILNKHDVTLLFSNFDKLPSTLGLIYILYYCQLSSNYNHEKLKRFYQKQLLKIIHQGFRPNKQHSFASLFINTNPFCSTIELSYSDWGAHNPIGFRLKDVRKTQSDNLVELFHNFEKSLNLPKMSEKLPIDIWTGDANEIENEEENIIIEKQSLFKFLSILNEQQIPTCVRKPSIRGL